MTLVQRDGSKKVQELTAAINVIPNTWGLINRMGLFKHEYKTQKNILVPRYTESDFLLGDKNWDEGANTLVDGKRDELPLKVPHFPVKDAILPNDVDGVASWSDVVNGLELETVANVRLRKMSSIRRTFANTLELARAKVITTGDVYSPNGTLRTSYGNTYNWYQEFGVAREEVDIDFSNAAKDPKQELDAVADLVDDGFVSGETIEQYIVLCSPEFFDALTNHPYVKDSVKYIDFAGISKELLIGSLGDGGLGAKYQVFPYGRMLYVRYHGAIGGERFIPENKAYAFPRAEGMFRTYFAPEQTFASINSVANDVYWYEAANKRGTRIDIEAESNFLNFISDPLAVVQMTMV